MILNTDFRIEVVNKAYLYPFLASDIWAKISRPNSLTKEFGLKINIENQANNKQCKQ